MTYQDFLKEHPNYIIIPVGNAKNHQNEKFNKLTPLFRVKNTNKPKHPNVQWLCQCDCGNFTVLDSSSFVTGHTKSCGCFQKEKAGKSQLKNEINNKYGKLTVIDYISNYEYRTAHCAYWKCKCDCGNEVIVRGTALRDGTTQSCGCLQSKGEEKISSILNANNINYKQQYTFPDLIDKEKLRFDFAIFNNKNELKFLIEYQGEQHYRNTSGWFGKGRFEDLQKKDQMKVEYCKKHSIKLKTIPYFDFDKIDYKYLFD